MRYHKVLFELDAKSVTNAISCRSVNFTEFGSIIEQCCVALDVEQNFQVGFIQRQANEIARILARASRCYASPIVFDVFPYVSLV
ncbi:hypothetical protein PTKIN_Ptkin10aG0175600 [Pterospermum kingtungense]